MAFLSVQRKMRSRPSARSATKAHPAQHRRLKHRQAVVGTTIERPTEAARPLDRLPEASAPEPAAYANRARAAGGPEDHALYTCTCGYVFEADVIATVGCPHCGTEQSW